MNTPNVYHIPHSEAHHHPVIESIANLAERKPVKYSVRAGLGLSALLLAGNAVAGISHGGDSPEIFGPANADIGSVVIDNDANLRYDPDVPSHNVDPNIFMKTDLEQSIEIPTPNGAYTHYDENGPWYGVPVENLNETLSNVDASLDNDGIIWVNEQRASPKSNK